MAKNQASIGKAAKEKGARAERDVATFFSNTYNKPFTRVPQSGGLDKVHQLKGDVYCPVNSLKYCIEVKSYDRDELNSGVLNNRSNKVISWLIQSEREAEEIDKLPLLVYKYTRSPFFVCVPSDEINFDEVDNVLYLKSKFLDYNYAVVNFESWLVNKPNVWSDT